MSTLTQRAYSFAEIQECLVQGAEALFATYGMPVERTESGAADIRGPAVMAVIGYAGDSMRGALLLLTSRTVVAALAPDEVKVSGAPEELALRDVLGEFANMLLGRVKNQLVRRDVAPLLSTPTTVFGNDLQLPAPTSGISAWHRFSAADGDLFVRFDATFEPGFALMPEGTVTPPIGEGELLDFEAGGGIEP